MQHADHLPLPHGPSQACECQRPARNYRSPIYFNKRHHDPGPFVCPTVGGWASVGRSWASVGRQLGFCTGAYVSFLVNEKTNLIALMQNAHFDIYK